MRYNSRGFCNFFTRSTGCAKVSSIIKKLFKCLLIGSFLFYPIFLMAAEKNKYIYHSQLSVLDFYLIRLYDIEKCGRPRNSYSKNISWCLKEFPEINKSNIELHFIIKKNSPLNESLIKTSFIERKQLILDGIDNFINNYWRTLGIYYEVNFKKQKLIGDTQLEKEIVLMNQELKEEENLKKLMDLYFHYCLDDKCYTTKKMTKL